MTRRRVALTPRQHDAVSRYVKGQTAAQIASELGIDESTIREHIWRAKAAYRAIDVEVGTKIALREAYQRNTIAR